VKRGEQVIKYAEARMKDLFLRMLVFLHQRVR